MTRPVRMENLDCESDGRCRSPSAERNKREILPELARLLAGARSVLEIASGTGEHAVYFAEALPHVTWQPTERDPRAFASIAAWHQHAALSNLRPPLELDLSCETAGLGHYDAAVAINLLHISPWSVTAALMRAVGAALLPGGVLCIYGAMFRDDVPTAPSNLQFDQSLRELDSALGIRRLEDVVRAAADHGLELDEVVGMPNNNVLAVWRRVP